MITIHKILWLLFFFFQVLILRKAQEDLEKEAKRKEEERVNAINELVPPLDIEGYDEGKGLDLT